MSRSQIYERIFLITLAILILIIKFLTIQHYEINDAVLYNEVAHRMFNGSLLYVDAWDHKPPGIFLIFLINSTTNFQNFYPAHILHILLLFLGSWSFYFILQQLFKLPSVYAKILTVLYSLGSIILFDGLVLNSEHFFTNLVLIGLAMLVGSLMRQPIQNKYFLPGMLIWSFAGFIKYHAILESLILIALLVRYFSLTKKQTLKVLFTYLVAMVLPYLLTIIYYISIGHLNDLYFALIKYNFFYVAQPGKDSYISPYLMDKVTKYFLLLIYPSILVYLMFFKRKIALSEFALIWFLSTVSIISIGYRYYYHYYMQITAPFLLLAWFAYNIYFARLNLVKRSLSLAVSISILLLFVWQHTCDIKLYQKTYNLYNDTRTSYLQLVQHLPSQHAECNVYFIDYRLFTASDINNVKYYLSEHYSVLSLEQIQQYYRSQNVDYIVSENVYSQYLGLDRALEKYTKVYEDKDTTIYKTGYCQ